ncbi:MAG: hypothetical protein ACMG6S_09640, partial [Byssovorax sp.]
EGVLRDMKLSEARAQKGATSWESALEMRHISRALFIETDLRAVLPSSLPGPGASVLGGKPRASVEARPAPARRPEPAQDKKVAVLEARVQKLETLLEQLLAKQEQVDEDDVDAPSDSHFEWIETHRDVLRAYPNAYVLLDPKKGIVFHSTDGDELTARLEMLAPEEQDRLMVFHTSMVP